MTIAEFDHLAMGEKRELLQKCCGSSAWVNKMLKTPPANDLIDLFEDADDNWNECTQEDWLEAFRHHPIIGDAKSIKDKFASTAGWAAAEQKGADNISEETSSALANGNKKYFEKFGYIFIVFATGKSANEMLDILQKRLLNSPEDEIKIAAAEQIRIAKNRLQKLFE
jgi:2-oxo-4-hydroxy-4-carboxy-5-ureidoimidazoline decarboxylase